MPDHDIDFRIFTLEQFRLCNNTKTMEMTMKTMMTMKMMPLCIRGVA